MNSSEASILSKVIPGFGSYASEQKRRDDDLALRRYLVERLQESKKILQSLAVGFVDKAMFDAIRDSENLRQQIELLQSKMRSATEGYSSWFESNKVDEKKLTEVLDLDNSLVGFIDKLDSDLKATPKDQPDFAASLSTLDRLKERFGRRGEILAK
ncbi:MAG: hypothetical protein MUC43_00665 [Pirellula sp.]|jgi:hypothetical protein|nr:hypothetical protein [Pirellula sp.]